MSFEIFGLTAAGSGGLDGAKILVEGATDDDADKSHAFNGSKSNFIGLDDIGRTKQQLLFESQLTFSICI